MAKYAKIGRILKEEFLPKKRITPMKTYKTLLEENIIKKSNKYFVVITENRDSVRKGTIVFHNPEESNEHNTFQSFFIDEKWGKTNLYLPTVTPVNIKDVDKKSCLLEIDYKKEAIEKFNESLYNEREREYEEDTSDEEFRCPECDEDLLECGVRATAILEEERTILFNQYGEQDDVDYGDSETMSQSDFRCPACDTNLEGTEVLGRLGL